MDEAIIIPLNGTLRKMVSAFPFALSDEIDVTVILDAHMDIDGPTAILTVDDESLTRAAGGIYADRKNGTAVGTVGVDVVFKISHWDYAPSGISGSTTLARRERDSCQPR